METPARSVLESTSGPTNASKGRCDRSRRLPASYARWRATSYSVMPAATETLNEPTPPPRGQVISRLAGAPGELLVDLYTPEEERRAQHMTMDELAADALQAKHLH